MNESKTVRINLKNLIEDFIFAYADKDEDSLNTLKEDFERTYTAQAEHIKKAMIKFIINNVYVKENKKMFKYFNTFVK